MILNLKRPLAFFDLETTGVNIGSDRIVEFSFLKIMPDGSEEVFTRRVNPQIPIPLESSLVHGIYDEDTKDAPAFRDLAPELVTFLADADLGGYNSNKFDIPMLMEEFLRARVDFDIENRHMVDVQNIFHQMEQRTLKAAVRFYCEKELEKAHSAEADVRATYEVLLAQVQRYAETDYEDKAGVKSRPVQNNVEALHLFTNLNKPVDFAGRMIYDEDGEEVFNFGKHKGRKVIDVFQAEPSYYSWMMQGDFPLYTKRKLEQVYARFNSLKAQLPKKEQPKKEDRKPYENKPAGQTQQQQPRPGGQAQGGRPQYQQRPRRDDKPSGPITGDMLDQLKNKFGK
ncbi:MAG: DNA polymerase III subunit epsilon [Mucilaginibacter polytrichastri]|nr:DNA polymerase III subunit epsilon [Mucilaginibacter polytrichastri]